MLVLSIFCLFFHFFSVSAQCQIPGSLQEEIAGYISVVETIFAEVISGDYKGKVYEDTSAFVDYYGHRKAGTDRLEVAIDGVIARIKEEGLEVSTHEAQIPSWTRGVESAEMITPTKNKLSILGLGSSGGTSEEGLLAPVIVVHDFDELEAVKDQVPGKIVLFHVEYISYGQSVKYRTQGPEAALKLGAVGCLVRSITPFSISSPHTGNTEFSNKSQAIPAAAISLEDADRIDRLTKRGYSITVRLIMDDHNDADTTSRNVIVDLPGSKIPNEYVVLSGHIDSWDVGQGAMDDAGGAFLSWHSLALIKKLNLPPTRRTIRAILWTAEESGIWGAKGYLKDRAEEIKNWTAGFESDGGVFQAQGFVFAGNEEATCIMQEILSLFTAINATTIQPSSSAGSDIDTFSELGIPLAEPLLVPNNYFWYHHSAGDYMGILKPEDMDQNVALHTATAYILADLSIKLPRD